MNPRSGRASKETMALYHYALVGFLAVTIYMASSTLAYAAGAPGSSAVGYYTPMGDVMCLILSYFFGNLGRSIACIAVVTIGVGASFGKVSWTMALMVTMGIAIIFGSAWLLYVLAF